MTPKQVKPSEGEDIGIGDDVGIKKARSKVRSWQRWGLYFIIFGFVTAFITWERIFGYILGLPLETIKPNIFWIATGIVEIITGFTLRIMGARYERKISNGEIPRLVS